MNVDAFMLSCLFSVFAMLAAVSLNCENMIIFEFLSSLNCCTTISEVFEIFGCSMFFVRRFWREI